MDLASQIALVEAQSHRQDEKSKIETLFVAPKPETLPDDGMLTYTVLESVYDVGRAALGSVLLVSDENQHMLKLVAENPLVFQRRLIVLSGLPDAVYGAGFDGAVWNCDKVAYSSLLSDLADSAIRDAAKAASSESKHDRERRSFTRANGTVKAHDAEVYKTDTDGETDSDSEAY